MVLALSAGNSNLATQWCPCGLLGRTDRPCECTPATVANYRARVSGPLPDRFEVQVEIHPLPVSDLRSDEGGETSTMVAVRTARARALQKERLRGTGVATNAALPAALLRSHANLDDASRSILSRAIAQLGLSARAHDGILRVTRTIADLDGASGIGPAHVAEAVQYRTLDREPVSTLRRPSNA